MLLAWPFRWTSSLSPVSIFPGSSLVFPATWGNPQANYFLLYFGTQGGLTQSFLPVIADFNQTRNRWINGLPLVVVWSGKAMDVPERALEKLLLTWGRVLIRAWRREPIRASFPALQGRSGQKTGLGQRWLGSRGFEHSALVSFWDAPPLNTPGRGECWTKRRHVVCLCTLPKAPCPLASGPCSDNLGGPVSSLGTCPPDPSRGRRRVGTWVLPPYSGSSVSFCTAGKRKTYLDLYL